MNILLTYDYELFLGSNTGSPEKCLIEPTNKLLEIFHNNSVKTTFFVDAAYLLKLYRQKKQNFDLERDWNAVSKQLKELTRLGHEIQLHIHPQWLFSDYSGKEWLIDQTNYSLTNIAPDITQKIFYDSKTILEKITGKIVYVYRAGGFTIQPFYKLYNTFLSNEIKIDSSVFPGGKYRSKAQNFDFTNCPDKSKWTFKDNPCNEDLEGKILEVPITSVFYTPLFYMQMIFHRKFGGKLHTKIGDGTPVKSSKKEILRRLSRKSVGPACCDGGRIRMLEKTYKGLKKQNKDTFVILGHPKLQTEYSLKKLNDFINKCKKKPTNRFIGYKEFLRNNQR